MRQEAIDLAAKDPAWLIILADSTHYMVAHLLARDTALRHYRTKIGPFDALVLSRSGRPIYMIEKLNYWPRDVLAEVQVLSKFAAFPAYIQSATISRYDKAQPAQSRIYRLE